MDRSSTPCSDQSAVAPVAQESSLPRTLWDAWQAYAHRAGGYQSQLLLSIVYFLVLGPSGLAARLAGTKLLDLDTRPRHSYWVERAPVEKTLAAVERQF